jgi:hypothetical protein
LERRLRANPAFELVLFDRLPAAEQRLLGALTGDPEHYGVLRPAAGSGLGVKAVDRETALLFLTLAAQPGALPRYVRQRLGDGGAAVVLARLVADSVLEIEVAPERFAGGAAAGAESAAGADGAGGGRVAALSRQALLYAQRLAHTLPAAEPLWLSWRLYEFHRRPVTPWWRRTLPDGEAVRRYLGLAGAGAALLERHWRSRPPAAAAPEAIWLRWRPRDDRDAASGGRGDGAATYKLYVSPVTEALPDVFLPVLDGLAAVGAPGFKVGGTASGLLRADKLVAYFATLDELAAAATAVGERLGDTPAHGVPFTSEIGGGGLLSWGVDPPPSPPGTLPWTANSSWRLWLTHRLARALLAAVRAGDGESGEGGEGGGEPWRFALERLRLDGVDTATWTPAEALWRAGEGRGPR